LAHFWIYKGLVDFVHLQWQNYFLRWIYNIFKQLLHSRKLIEHRLNWYGWTCKDLYLFCDEYWVLLTQYRCSLWTLLNEHVPIPTKNYLPLSICSVKNEFIVWRRRQSFIQSADYFFNNFLEYQSMYKIENRNSSSKPQVWKLVLNFWTLVALFL